MSGKTLLFLSTGHFHACTWKSGVLSEAQHFSNDPHGREQFAAFLQDHRDPAYLLTDFIEEDFRYETVPHLRGSDRSAVLQRKLDQYYRNTPFRQALLQRRQKDGRRDDEVLFSALTNPTLVLPWLNIMQAHCIPLAGIYSAPGISSPLIKDNASAHLLLLSWEKHAGLRQTYFEDKHLYFSRLTPMGTADSLSGLIDTEAARTQQYLKSLSLLPQNHVLDVSIICDANDRRELEAHLRSNPNIRYAYLDIQELGQRFGTTTGHTGSDATPLLLNLLAAKPPRSNYASNAHTHFFQLRQLRQGLYGLGATLATACLLWSAVNIWDAGRLSSENESLGMQASQVTQQAQQITQSLPNTSSTAADMRTAALLLRKLDSFSPPPQKILAELSATLNAYTHIRVDKLAWQMDTAPQGAGQSGVTPDNRATDSAAAPLAAQTILLSGELEGLSGDYRGALNYLERFQQSLTQRGHTVTALTLPLDVSPQGSISGDAVENNAKPAQFSLMIMANRRLR